MMPLTIWKAEQAAERQLWLGLWQRWPGREVFAHPTYVELFAAPDDLVRCAVLESEHGTVLFPFIARPLADEAWTDVPALDLTTAYGYGGPFVVDAADSASLADEFWPAFRAEARALGAVSLFARLTLFEEDRLPWPEGMVELKRNVVRRLDLPADEIWRDYEHKVRKNVRIAERNGLRVTVDTEGVTLDDFLRIYEATMARVGATDTYYFPPDFYERLIREVPGSVAFFHVQDGDRVVSTELVLVSARHIYSFLGGTDADAFRKRPNDLLKHEVIRWGSAQGKAAYVLGGGYDGEDGIFRYKKSFASHGVLPYYVGRMIFDPARYEELVAARDDWERQHGRIWQPGPDFFPAYRG